ncbi:hypothetical protein DFJ74DRAFT_476023 [Hyaloraphidium curvatum]|nr:hypothetical protein DFJ74DRAFT_476023 [Hyaloraphidium curvatum]
MLLPRYAKADKMAGSFRPLPRPAVQPTAREPGCGPFKTDGGCARASLLPLELCRAPDKRRFLGGRSGRLVLLRDQSGDFRRPYPHPQPVAAMVLLPRLLLALLSLTVLATATPLPPNPPPETVLFARACSECLDGAFCEFSHPDAPPDHVACVGYAGRKGLYKRYDPAPNCRRKRDASGRLDERGC